MAFFTSRPNTQQTPTQASQMRRTIMPTLLRPTRREALATGAAAIVTSLLPGQRATAAEASSGGVPSGPGSVFGAPNLPEGFANTFTMRIAPFSSVKRDSFRPSVLDDSLQSSE